MQEDKEEEKEAPGSPDGGEAKELDEEEGGEVAAEPGAAEAEEE